MDTFNNTALRFTEDEGNRICVTFYRTAYDGFLAFRTLRNYKTPPWLILLNTFQRYKLTPNYSRFYINESILFIFTYSYLLYIYKPKHFSKIDFSSQWQRQRHFFQIREQQIWFYVISLSYVRVKKWSASNCGESSTYTAHRWVVHYRTMPV